MARPLTVIEDATISALLSNPSVIQAVPELKAAAARVTAASDCVPCRKKQEHKATNYAYAKRAIGTLPRAKLEVIRRALGAEQLRVYYTSETGKAVKLTYTPRS